MSASKRGAGQWHAIRCTSRFIRSAGNALIAVTKSTATAFTATQSRKRRRIDLQALNDHALRDIGFVRDRFTGTLLNDVSGKVADLEGHQTEAIGAAVSDIPAIGRHIMVERRLAERRTAGRRRIARRRHAEQDADGTARLQHPAHDRRAYGRRASDHRVIDCRSLFSRRARFLPV